MSRSFPACRGVRRDLRLARGLQLAPTPLITGDARSLGVRRAMEPRQRGVRRCCLTAVATPRMRWPALSHTAAVLAELPRDAAEDLLARLDRVVPSRIESFYVVGSASMGALQPSRSDVDISWRSSTATSTPLSCAGSAPCMCAPLDLRATPRHGLAAAMATGVQRGLPPGRRSVALAA